MSLGNFSDPFRLIWSALKTWYQGLFGLLLLGLVWLLCWATLVLGPPATFGFYHAVRVFIVEKEIRWPHFYRPAKEAFFASWAWFLANLLVLFLVFSNYVFYGGMASRAGIYLQILALMVGFLWMAVQLYALPYYVLLEKKSLFIAWKNGLFTILASPIFSLVVWVVLAVLAGMHLTLFPFLLGGPGFFVVLTSMAVEDRIQKFGLRKDETSDGEGTPMVGE